MTSVPTNPDTAVTITFTDGRREMTIECHCPLSAVMKLVRDGPNFRGDTSTKIRSLQEYLDDADTSHPDWVDEYSRFELHVAADQSWITDDGIVEDSPASTVMIGAREVKQPDYCAHCGKEIVKNSLGFWLHKHNYSEWCKIQRAVPGSAPEDHYTPNDAQFWSYLDNKHVVEIREAVGAAPNETWSGVVDRIRERFQSEESPHEEESHS